MNKMPKLDKRAGPFGAFHVGSYSPGGSIDLADQTVSVGHSAVLHSGEARILAKITKAEAAVFEGEIFGFEGVDDDTFDNLRAGDFIVFTAAEIHGVLR